MLKKKLYKRTYIFKNKMDEIINIFDIKKNNINSKYNISSILYYSKPFLSFPKDSSNYIISFKKSIRIQ